MAYKIGIHKWCLDADLQVGDSIYGSMMMKLLPFNMNVHSHKDVVYHKYSDVSAALADRGVDLEVLNKMKLIELKVERPPEDEQNNDNGNGV